MRFAFPRRNVGGADADPGIAVEASEALVSLGGSRYG